MNQAFLRKLVNLVRNTVLLRSRSVGFAESPIFFHTYLQASDVAKY
jgi:hypothetical protein